MIKFKQIQFETEADLIAKFNRAALSSGLSIFDLFYDGKSFYRHIVEDDYYEEI